MTGMRRHPLQLQALADPSTASRRLAWLLTLVVHLILVGTWLARSPWQPTPAPASEPPRLVLRLSPPAPAAPRILEPPRALPTPPPPAPRPEPEPEPRPDPKPAPPRPSRAKPQPAPAVPPPPPGPTASATAAEVAPAPTPAASPAPVSAAQARPDPDLEARRQGMLDELAGMLEREKRYPLAARRGGISGRVLLLVEFDAQGRPLSWRVVGDEAPAVLARATLEAMERANRRLSGGLPLLAGRQVRVPMHYRLE